MSICQYWFNQPLKRLYMFKHNYNLHGIDYIQFCTICISLNRQGYKNIVVIIYNINKIYLYYMYSINGFYKNNIENFTDTPLSQLVRQKLIKTQSPQPMSQSPQPMTQSPQPMIQSPQLMTQSPQLMTRNPQPIMTQSPQPIMTQRHQLMTAQPIMTQSITNDILNKIIPIKYYNSTASNTDNINIKYSSYDINIKYSSSHNATVIDSLIELYLILDSLNGSNITDIKSVETRNVLFNNNKYIISLVFKCVTNDWSIIYKKFVLQLRNNSNDHFYIESILSM